MAESCSRAASRVASTRLGMTYRPGLGSVETTALDRCHLVPRTLGGDESPSNLVLLCRRCHRDAPNVGHPTYVLRWIAEQESHLAHMWTFIESVYERADLRDAINTFSTAELPSPIDCFAIC